MKLTRKLKYGCRGDDVKWLQNVLRSTGDFEGWIGGNFKALTKGALIDFQMRAVDPKTKRPLTPDGEVWPGYATERALNNPSGAAQSTGLGRHEKADLIPDGLSESRQRIIQTWITAYRSNIREIPDGSNTGDGVTRLHQPFPPSPWCMWSMSEMWKDTYGEYFFGKKQGHCVTVRNIARRRGVFHPVGEYEPIPGDLFIMVTNASKSQGHTGGVFRVNRTGSQFNTFEGNAGNRFKLGIRSTKQSTLVGFVNLHGDEDHRFERGIIKASDVSRDGTR